MNNNIIKFTDVELSAVESIRTRFQEKLIVFGQIHLSRLQLTEQAGELDKLDEKTKEEYLQLQKEEETLLNTITSNYGEGSLDFKTGIFTPNKK